MSFELNGLDEDVYKKIKRQFTPFLKEGDGLPFCRINFYDKQADMTSGARLIKKVGIFSFYLTDDGIMVSDPSSFAFVRKNFTGIDVYVSKNRIVPEMQLAFLILQAYRYVIINAGHFQMHSAVVVKNGVGIAFCGLSGAGKSTQAHLWEDHVQATPLNLDQPCVLFENDNVLVSGSPWSGKEDCYVAERVPLGAVFFVEQSDVDTAERLSGAEAFSYIYLNNYLVPIEERFDELQRAAVEKLVCGVPVYRLKCTVSKNAVDAAYRAVFKE